MKIKRLEHVAVTVSDLGEAKDMLTNFFGLTMEYEERVNTTDLAMFPIGDTYIELLHSSDPTSRTGAWMSKHGTGLFHICLEIEDIVEAVEELKAKGVRLLNDTPAVGHNNSRIVFIDPASTGNLFIELVELRSEQ